MTKEIKEANWYRPNNTGESRETCATGEGISGIRSVIFLSILLVGGLKYIHTQTTGSHENNYPKVTSSTLK